MTRIPTATRPWEAVHVEVRASQTEPKPQVSTRCHDMPCRDISCCVHVGVRPMTATHAHEGRLALATFRGDGLAGVAGLGGVRSLDFLDPDHVEASGEVGAGFLDPVFAPVDLPGFPPADQGPDLPAPVRTAPGAGEPALQSQIAPISGAAPIQGSPGTGRGSTAPTWSTFCAALGYKRNLIPAT